MARDEREPEDEEGAVGPFNDALAALGDETRLRILLELAEVANEEGMGTGLSFSELRKRVGVADSGRFNYHLGKLEDQFVTNVDGEYVARYPGLAVIAAMYAGEYRDVDAERAARMETNYTCPECSEPADLNYGRQTLYSGVWMECDEHDSFDRYPVPPGGAHDRSLEGVLNLAHMRSHVTMYLGRQGICLECWGSV